MLALPLICSLVTRTQKGSSSLPFGGFKKSGLGGVHGPEGLRAFAQTQAVSANRWLWRFSDELWWFL